MLSVDVNLSVLVKLPNIKPLRPLLFFDCFSVSREGVGIFDLNSRENVDLKIV